MIDIDKIEQLEHYLEDNLRGENLQDFEEQLIVDQNMSNQLHDFNTAVKEIRSIGREDLKIKFKHYIFCCIDSFVSSLYRNDTCLRGSPARTKNIRQYSPKCPSASKNYPHNFDNNCSYIFLI